jgi:HD superfamily phosphodiesterase
MKLLNELFNFVVLTSKLYEIDESHSIKHSMDVFYFANKIYESELIKNPYLIEHKNIIDTSSIIHDMCDKKYMNEEEGLKRINEYLTDKITEKELEISLKIISTMSYSTVIKNGYPNLDIYQRAYDIVREADLLASYDFDRCVIYKMLRNTCSYEEACVDAFDLFDKRVFKYLDDKLFITDYSKKIAGQFHIKSLNRINNMRKILKL